MSEVKRIEIAKSNRNHIHTNTLHTHTEKNNRRQHLYINVLINKRTMIH